MPVHPKDHHITRLESSTPFLQDAAAEASVRLIGQYNVTHDRHDCLLSVLLGNKLHSVQFPAFLSSSVHAGLSVPSGLPGLAAMTEPALIVRALRECADALEQMAAHGAMAHEQAEHS